MAPLDRGAPVPFNEGVPRVSGECAPGTTIDPIEADPGRPPVPVKTDQTGQTVTPRIRPDPNPRKDIETMKTLLASGCIAACALLTACGPDSGEVVTIEEKDVRPAAEPVPPPGSDVKLGSNNTGGPGTAPPKKD